MKVFNYHYIILLNYIKFNLIIHIIFIVALLILIFIKLILKFKTCCQNKQTYLLK